jgi:hypothetical protein
MRANNFSNTMPKKIVFKIKDGTTDSRRKSKYKLSEVIIFLFTLNRI